MSRSYLDLDSKRTLVFGYDHDREPSQRTWFVQLWDEAHDPDFEWGAPAAAAGYSPDEQKIEPLAGEYGPYPLSFEGLEVFVRAHGANEQQVREVVNRAAQMEDRRRR